MLIIPACSWGENMAFSITLPCLDPSVFHDGGYGEMGCPRVTFFCWGAAPGSGKQDREVGLSCPAVMAV